LRKKANKQVIPFLLVILLGLLLLLWARTVTAEIKKTGRTQNLYTTTDRVNCIRQYGWEVDPGGETKRKVVIPNPLDDVYREYNKLQLPCGFDLSHYVGKGATCYTYPVLNFPYKTDERIYVNILVTDNTLIGGDCMSRALDGFMLPLDRTLMP